MRMVRTHVGHCPTHPSAATQGDQGGRIRCTVCEVDVGQWSLPRQAGWVVAGENAMARVVAATLPQSVIRWALRRAVTHATQPRWGDLSVQSADTMTAYDVALRWELQTPPVRLPHLPEWMRGYLKL